MDLRMDLFEALLSWQQLLPGPTPPSLLPGQGGHYIEIFWVLHQFQVEGLNFDIDTVLGEGEH